MRLKGFLLVLSTFLLSASLMEPGERALASSTRLSSITVTVSTGAALTPPTPVNVIYGEPDIAASADFQREFDEISMLCFQFTFVGDLLDHDDSIFLTGPIGIGMTNVSSSPQSAREICTMDASDTSYFLDGKEDFGLKSGSGSVTVGSLDVVVTIPAQVIFLPLVRK